MAKFKMGVTAPSAAAVTARLGSAANAGGNVTDKETGKFVKLVGDSQYDAVAVTNPIDGYMVALEPATVDGWSIGSVQKTGRLNCICDGLEATPGTGSIAVGDYVVAGTVVAKGTALTTGPKVCKATNQPGTAIVSTVGAADTAAAIKTQIDAVLVKVASAQANTLAGWRVVSLGNAGAVADTCVIERV